MANALEQNDSVRHAQGSEASEHVSRMQAEVQQERGSSAGNRATDAPASGSSAGSHLPALELHESGKVGSSGGPGGGGGFGNRCFSDGAAGGSAGSGSAKVADGSAPQSGSGNGAYRAGHVDMVAPRHQ
ncbi:MAG: hypothetical protein JSS86_10410 [Cyanobacteria bacterium SZAS LIN-2]|nr:hypothetical protein [Cyanobacteria bacterium SZAS LIN-3]MBS1996716.1 hypothetical protein [Cyanobacteria bacterium SZAS LIN-2]MBS2006545.1 hypothetical protein [Cyanobacteria bacterium SZAS TMP-1]